MRYGVIADVHGNLHALEAVLAALRRAGAERYICAGDLVGYGPLPNECVRAVAELDPVCVAGNHDLIALGRLPDDGTIALARDTLRWTRERLADDVVAYLEALPLSAVAGDGVVVAHGSLDEPRSYVLDADRAERELERLSAVDASARMLLLGHTHRALAFRVDAEGAEQLRPDRVALSPDARFLLNPGSVGQSRELRVRSRCMVLDLDRGQADFLAVSYDTAACRAALRRSGLPPRAYHLGPSPIRAAGRLAKRALRRIASPRG